MNINEHQDQRYTRGDNNGRDLYLLGVNVLVSSNLSIDSLLCIRFQTSVFVLCLVSNMATNKKNTEKQF